MRMSFFSDRLFKFILGGLVFLFVLITIKDVYTQPPSPTYPYTLSAHGNVSYGVNRIGLSSFNYSKGNCAHCHEQHASIGGAEPAPAGGAPSKYELFRSLFTDQSSMFCYPCHQDAGAQQVLPAQYNYSYIAGGDTGATCPNNIRAAFVYYYNSAATGGCGARASTLCGYTTIVYSAHCLYDIRVFLNGKWNFGSVAADIDPCSGCHNPHRTQRDHLQPGQAFQWTNGVSSLSKPSTHSKDNNVWTLWGDDSTERMSNYNYQPPYRYNSTTTYEPDDDATNDKSRTVDFVALCTDCHNTTYTITSTKLGTLKKIDWSYDQHGSAYQVCCDYGDKKAPYSNATNYVLSCLDCHEPHGSPNEYLLREEVNGTHVGQFNAKYWYNFCSACHINLNKHMPGIGPSNNNCWGCHTHGWNNGSTCGCSQCKTF